MLDLIKLRQTKFKLLRSSYVVTWSFQLIKKDYILPWDIATNDFSTANWQILHIFSYFILIMLKMLIRKWLNESWNRTRNMIINIFKPKMFLNILKYEKKKEDCREICFWKKDSFPCNRNLWNESDIFTKYFWGII